MNTGLMTIVMVTAAQKLPPALLHLEKVTAAIKSLNVLPRMG